jgi:hypothetical protein
MILRNFWTFDKLLGLLRNCKKVLGALKKTGALKVSGDFWVIIGNVKNFRNFQTF